MTNSLVWSLLVVVGFEFSQYQIEIPSLKMRIWSRHSSLVDRIHLFACEFHWAVLATWLIRQHFSQATPAIIMAQTWVQELPYPTSRAARRCV